MVSFSLQACLFIVSKLGVCVHDLAPMMTCKVVNKTSQVYLLFTLTNKNTDS